MEGIKRFLFQMGNFRAPTGKEMPEVVSLDHVMTIDDAGRAPEMNKRTKRKAGVIFDLLFCIFIILLWVIALSILVRTGIEKPNEELFYFGYFVLVLVITVTGVYFEALILRGFERLTPKVAVCLRKSVIKSMFTLPKLSTSERHLIGPYVIRMRLFQNPDEDFIETELDENQLTIDGVLELCAKELGVEKKHIVRVRKLPETKIRSDADVKRFSRLEYLEVFSE
nr:PREDICTED: uncharacterized protein LOC103312983 isoform X1 [Tribolium castaneum]|eukprot:XP_008193200.1 PREDICTED: uncharacterized protein LOC103312983 isoform X1 [Tribolium castaneum]